MAVQRPSSLCRNNSRMPYEPNRGEHRDRRARAAPGSARVCEPGRVGRHHARRRPLGAPGHRPGSAAWWRSTARSAAEYFEAGEPPERAEDFAGWTLTSCMARA